VIICPLWVLRSPPRPAGGGDPGSIGPIQDRSKENLTSTDNGVILARCARHGRDKPGHDAEIDANFSASGLDRRFVGDGRVVQFF
jgi:hypothetical protein